MSKEEAKAHYLGSGGVGRLNCAQAIIKAFSERYKLDQELIGLFAGHGGGNAPGGLCGAYYAARHILEKHHPEKVAEFEKYFCDQAGSLECKPIRKLKKLSCLGCIEKAADYLSSK